ncbi:MAG: nitroreductase [Clostridia bacterium]|nr:nitroreductase [Clostridia bacterium]
MDLIQGIMERRSIRQFLDKEVPNEDLEEIIRIASWAPSGANQQMWKFIIVKNKNILDQMSRLVADKIDRLAEETGYSELVRMKAYSTFFNKAPATIAVFMEPYKNKAEEVLRAAGYSEERLQRLRGNAGIQSIGAVIQNILLAAHAKGYGTCWMCAPIIAAPEIEKILEVEEPWQLKALIPIGKPASIPKAPSRKPLTEILKIIE